MPKSSNKTLNLFFPQWQGSARLELYEGAKLLYDVLHHKIPFEQVPVSLTYSLTSDENILGYNQISSQLLDACRVIQAHSPERILTIGGDCGVEIAPISFLNARHDQSLSVIWLDAHSDLNTPSSSPSAHFHGMPLRVLLGHGDTRIVNCAFSTLRPEQVFLVGTREFDLAEKDLIQQEKLTIFSAEDINLENFSNVFSALSKSDSGKIYIHLDLDVIDPKEFPHVACSTPDGIHIDKLKNFLVFLRQNFNVVGCSVLEFLPTCSKQSAALEIAHLLESAELTF
ncbi:arginase family protein [Nodosilinea sp. LEGE 06152]|uniref:arginase family protein n=1 Tax=Nodosilinea sp. LEGE 06152 TaxID=2777966 RepID=UPI00187DF981|nr:arginase family protein [Nodosilinea sp. LEGE 06152]MBE9156188.1 arginase family protein [Nodosilinea sp. LEGE 06152]